MTPLYSTDTVQDGVALWADALDDLAQSSGRRRPAHRPLGAAKAQRAGRRLDQLQQSYWDLRYEHGRLRAQVKRLDPYEAVAEPEPHPIRPRRSSRCLAETLRHPIFEEH